MLLLIVAVFVIGSPMLPVIWSGNEIVYFDLAYRSVQPDAFTDHHAMFDASNSRVAAMWFIGYFVKAFGFEAAKTILAVLFCAICALGIAQVAKALDMRVAELLVALAAFLLARQSIVGGEWIFGTIEPKVLAYACVIFGFAATLKGRGLLMVALLAAGTWFHFLVGGAWALLFLLLWAMMRPNRWEPVRLLAVYCLLVLPIVVILLRERVGETVDLSALPATIDQLYALFRAPNHVAPFARGWTGFGVLWMPGIMIHAALAAILFLFATDATGRDRTLLRWAGILNALLPAAAIAAYLDSNTHHLGKFLIFRPSAFVLLVTCLFLARSVFPMARQRQTHIGAAITLLIVAIVLPSHLIGAARMMVKFPPATRLESQVTAGQRDVTRWLSANTPPDAAILLEPPSDFLVEGDVGMERLSGRGFIVFFKNVPSDTADFVRWYNLLAASRAFFDGDCGQLSLLQADYVVFRSASQPTELGQCTDLIYENEEFQIARARNGP